MADVIGKLLKTEDNDKKISPAESENDLRESKRRLGRICGALLIEPDDYKPAKTVNSINTYIKNKKC